MQRERTNTYNPIQRNLISLIFFYQEEQIKKREEKQSDATPTTSLDCKLILQLKKKKKNNTQRNIRPKELTRKGYMIKNNKSFFFLCNLFHKDVRDLLLDDESWLWWFCFFHLGRWFRHWFSLL